MSLPLNLDRRVILRGLGAAGVAAAASPALPQTGRVTRPAVEVFEARSADGTTLIGDVSGDVGAPEILFVHGLRQSRLCWERQYDDPALAGFRKVRFDLRGHGDSDKPDSPDSYADLGRWADDVAAVIAAVQLRRPVLAAWSLGGLVTGSYLSRYSNTKVAGVNLVDAVTKLSPDLLTSLAARYAGSTNSHDLAERTAETADFLLACFHRPPDAVALRRMLVVNGMTARAVNEGLGKTGPSDFQPVFAASRVPLLLTHGVHDRLVRIAMATSLQRLCADARLSVFTDSGHSPFYEEARRFNRELAAFAAFATRA